MPTPVSSTLTRGTAHLFVAPAGETLPDREAIADLLDLAAGRPGEEVPATAAELTGVAPTDTDFSEDPYSFDLAIDGAAADTITLDQDYGDAQSVAVAILNQSLVTGFLVGTTQDGRIIITSGTTGAASSVEVSNEQGGSPAQPASLVTPTLTPANLDFSGSDLEFDVVVSGDPQSVTVNSDHTNDIEAFAADIEGQLSGVSVTVDGNTLVFTTTATGVDATIEIANTAGAGTSGFADVGQQSGTDGSGGQTWAGLSIPATVTGTDETTTQPGFGSFAYVGRTTDPVVFTQTPEEVVHQSQQSARADRIDHARYDERITTTLAQHTRANLALALRTSQGDAGPAARIADEHAVVLIGEWGAGQHILVGATRAAQVATPSITFDAANPSALAVEWRVLEPEAYGADPYVILAPEED